MQLSGFVIPSLRSRASSERSEGSRSGERSFAALRMTLLKWLRLTRKTSYSPGIAHFMVLGAPQEHGLFEMYWAKGRSRTIDVKLSAASPNSVKVARKVSPGATGTAPHIEPDRTCWQTKSALRTR